MKSGKYKYILIFITITILATIGLQLHWNLKNYKENKAQLIKEVQTAFDNSIEYYYVEDSKNDFLAFVDDNDSISNDAFFDKIQLDTVFKNNVSRMGNRKFKKTLAVKDSALKKQDTAISFAVSMEFSETSDDNNTHLTAKMKDSIRAEVRHAIAPKTQLILKNSEPSSHISSIRVLKGKKASDSISKLKDFANRIVISMFQDSIAFDKLSKALDKEFTRKNIVVNYSLQHFKGDTLFAASRRNNNTPLPLSSFSGTTYLPPTQKLQISFSDPTILILKRSATEIALSLLLSLSIIFCLLYLLQTINQQKKTDEIKNDLISNITHEFKTPITTISSAIEGIRNFNDTGDTEKTNRYLNISGQQLRKLEIMVEKLLETASLDTDQLVLQKEGVNLVQLLAEHTEKFQLLHPDKKLVFSSQLNILLFSIDLFHFENALSNLIDNAVKYGGNQINITLKQEQNKTFITVEDDGNGIEKSQREKIFDKFYRVPKGNVHDVKGFGIGLYYAKKIIEKHGGKLELLPEPATTIFKISLAHV